jgi:DNA-binding XRE family transcriptional regulator
VDRRKRDRLHFRGWTVGSASDFLGLTPEETQFIELKLALSGSLREERVRQGVTQTRLAELLGSSQSRVAKMEAGDPSVSVDLLLKALLKLGVTRARIARSIS